MQETETSRYRKVTRAGSVLNKQGAGGGGSCGVSANEYTCAHHVTWSPNKLWRSNYSTYLTCDFKREREGKVTFAYTRLRVMN
jgi:hypothetical protein